MSSEEKKRPKKKYRVGCVSAAIWEDQVEADGRTEVRCSVSFERSYRDPATQEWRNSKSFFAEDLPRLQLVAGKAYEFLVLREDEKGAAGVPF